MNRTTRHYRTDLPSLILATLRDGGTKTRNDLRDWMGRPYGFDYCVSDMLDAGTLREVPWTLNNGHTLFHLAIAAAT